MGKRKFAEQTLETLLHSFKEGLTGGDPYLSEDAVYVIARMLDLHRHHLKKRYVAKFTHSVLLLIDMNLIRKPPNDGKPHKESFEYFIRAAFGTG